MHVEIGPRLFQVTLSTLALPGEEERVHIIAFLPVAKGGTGDQTMSTTRIQTAAMQP
jgi:hypothetical protein